MTIQLEKLVATLELDTKLFKAGAAAAVAGVAAVVAGMGVAIKATMDWAADIDSLGDVMDGTNEQFAALAFVARKSGVGVDKLTRANVILEKSLLKANGTLDTNGQKLRQYGIHVKDANGLVKDSVQLTDEIAEKYKELGTQQERVNFLTEIYGKSGADMIDFFDTLANEGGIDKVTEKVKNLGLAIDPARYEQFNRNLEELKLIGLGLAVSFTEKAMPAIEKFLEMVTDFAADPDLGKLAKRADTFIGNMLDGLADDVDNWVAGGGADRLSKKIIGFIEDLGSGEGVKSAALDAAKELGKSLINAFKEIDWEGVDEAMDGLDAKVNAAIDEMFVKGDIAIRNGLDNIDQSFNNWATALPPKIRASLDTVDKDFNTWASDTWNTVKAWNTNVNSEANAALASLGEKIETKLREIAKTFFNRAAAWGQQMVKGFQSGQAGILAYISELVGEINKILRKIITTFTLKFGFSDKERDGASDTFAGFGGSNPVDNERTEGGRATGGAVIAGQAYMVGERGRERFVPHRAGRVEPSGQQSSPRWDAKDFAREFFKLAEERNVRLVG